MMEVLTKKFWVDVKRTFDEALEGTTVKAGETATSAQAPTGDVLSTADPTPKLSTNTADIETPAYPEPADSSQATSVRD
jgi:hypothetical protein